MRDRARAFKSASLLVLVLSSGCSSSEQPVGVGAASGSSGTGGTQGRGASAGGAGVNIAGSGGAGAAGSGGDVIVDDGGGAAGETPGDASAHDDVGSGGELTRDAAGPNDSAPRQDAQRADASQGGRDAGVREGGSAIDGGDRLPDGRTIEQVVLSVARRQIRTLADGTYVQGSQASLASNKAPVGLDWKYPWGVALYGMLRVSAVTGDPAPKAFVLQHNQIAAREYHYLSWQQKTYGTLTGAGVMSSLMNLQDLDSCGSMTSQLVEGVLTGGQPATVEQEELGAYVDNYISTKQSRLPDGTLWRPERGMTVWDDDLYMSCPFLVRWYQHTGAQKFLDDAAKQVLNMAGRQQDKDGVWFHASFISENVTNGVKWGRANGWAMVSAVEVLSAMPEGHPDRPRLLDILRKHVEGIKPLQAPSGMWRQVLDHPELWEETSCTAMFSYSIARAVRRGWIDPQNLEVARRGFAGLSANVTSDGRVNETCVGTGIGRTVSFYADRTRPPNDPHGPGPVMLAGSELIEALNGR